MIFKDPAAALDKTRRRIADVDSNIESLKAKRQELLATPDDDNVADIQRINKSIEAEEANKKIYEAKVIALAEEVRRGEYQSREKRRKEAIEKIAAKLTKREEIATQLELSLAEPDIYIRHCLRTMRYPRFGRSPRRFMAGGR